MKKDEEIKLPSELPTSIPEYSDPAPPPKSIPFSEADVSLRYDDVYQEIRPDAVDSVEWLDDAYLFTCKNGVSLRISILSPTIIRLRYRPEGQFGRDFSYARDYTAPVIKSFVTLNENENEYILSTQSLQIVVSRSNLRVRFFNSDDRTICEDTIGFSARRTVMSGWSEMRITKKCHPHEAFFGLGDKTAGPNLRGHKYQNWCTDSFGFHDKSDELYRAIPFFYALHQGVSYGIFFDNTYRTWFDFDKDGKGEYSFWAEGGEVDYYFLYGPRLQDVSLQYAQLTGKAALPPLWALGYHQCRWSYYPESRVDEVAESFRKLQIPCDSLYLDIDYMDGYRCFTWDKNHFPDLKGMVARLRQNGFRTVAMLDPGIKEDPQYFVYKEGIEKGHFLKNPDGYIAKGPVWPGFCAFPDFTNPATRQWWAGLHRELVQDLGIHGFWNDMNEPAVFHINHKTLPDSVLHHYDGEQTNHKKAHNIYGQTMCMASLDGIRKHRPEARPFLLGRSGYSGGQRYMALWTGDNWADWNHLQLANVQCVRLSVSGYSFVGTDIGGFAGPPDGELYLRWLQLGVFHPLMRTHSMGRHTGGDHAVTEEAEMLVEENRRDVEPWSFGEQWTPHTKRAIELRYMLLGVIYTAFWQHTKYGTPVLRHTIWADENDRNLWENERDFLFGEHILVSPVIKAKQLKQKVYLPKGNWYYFWTGHHALGNADFGIDVRTEEIPFFVRAGAVLPIYPVRQWTDERPVEELTLYAYYQDGKLTSHLYEDAGEGFAFLSGDYGLQVFETEGTNHHFSIRRKQEGRFIPTWKTVKIMLIGVPFFVRYIAVDGKETPVRERRVRDRPVYNVEVGPNFREVTFTVGTMDDEVRG